MIWNYHDVDKKNITADVALNINGINATKVKVVEYRIDEASQQCLFALEKNGLSSKSIYQTN